MQLTFKKATPNDIPVIAKLADTIWKQYYPSIITQEQIDYMLKKMYTEEQLLKQMQNGHIFTLVYFNDQPAGYVSVSTNDNKYYFLHKFYILVDEHKRGIGTCLFNYLLKQIPLAKTIELTVNRQNYKAINFYFKNGFIIKEVADFDIGNGYFMNDFVMVKSIF